MSFGERFDWPDEQAEERGNSGYCRALFDQIAVLSDGTVVPCCLDHEGTLALGNLFRQELSGIIASPLARAIREGFEKGSAPPPYAAAATQSGSEAGKEMPAQKGGQGKIRSGQMLPAFYRLSAW